ncbi:MAG: class I poly(R)-hydroxyalkanoic acid synthase [Leptothrix ochracea]|uniref:class I poly(R)-hydroxyalkanoic acid synthase n=1 Tax=Leptothrix ochracea TaxID=735331 RepID=UPI0034E1EC2D
MSTARKTTSRARSAATTTPAAEPVVKAPKKAAAPKVSAPTPAAPTDLVTPVLSLGESLGKSLQGFAHLSMAPDALGRIQTDYLRQFTDLWNTTLTSPTEVPKVKDRRFSAEAWQRNPASSFLASAYLLNANTLLNLADAVQGDEKTRQRMRFAVQQWVDAAAPSNFLALNPEAQQKALETKGESITHGVTQLLKDIQQGHVSQTDESLFEVGRNVATTEGTVVFENDFFQLLEYKPLTEQVHAKPMLFVPPCINKYYIMDLQPDNSLIRYTVAQGHRVFVLSWRNPDESLVSATWDDYIEQAVIKAVHVVQEIGGTDTIDTLGFCVGGTLLTTALAVLAARGEQPAASITLLTTLLDFSNTGILDIFIDETAVKMREMTLGADAPNGPGMLRGKELASTFSFLRPNDLVWNYVVGNYLKGETPPPFDLLYWNSDSTNLPGPMYCWYLRNTYLENNLKEPGKATVCGEAVDFGAIKAPVYFYASREDHIVPWDSAFMGTKLLKGPKRFVLGASGHIAGVINPPAKKKRNYWTAPKLTATAQDWLDSATEHPGSWWTDWSDWLAKHAGPLEPAPKTPGTAQYRPIEPAPGRYVKHKV